MPFHDLIGTYTQQDVEIDKVFADVALYNNRIMGPTHVESVADLACRTAISRRAVAHLAFPVDLQDKPVERKGSKRNIPHHTSDAFARSARLPAESDVTRAAEILNEGGKVAILAGQGALGAGELLEETADRLAAPIIKARLGKAVVPDDSPFTTGTVGLLGTKPSQEALEKCDTLLMVGTSFPTSSSCPSPAPLAPFKSSSIRPAWACDIRLRSASWVTAAGPSRCFCRSSFEKTTGVFSNAPRRVCANGGSSWRSVARAPTSR